MPQPHRFFLFALVLVGVAMASTPAAGGSDPPRIEIIQVSGIIDGPVERAVLATIEDAEREGAALVVVQIDSRGVVDQDRASRMLEKIQSALVPVASWIPPGGRAENFAAILVVGADRSGMAPGSTIGPVETSDLRSREGEAATRTLRQIVTSSGEEELLIPDRRAGATEAVRTRVVGVLAPSLSEFLEEIDGRRVGVGDDRVRLSIDPDEALVRFHQLDLVGRALHAAAQPSNTYLLLLLALIGIVFELFHPATGPAGVTGLAALALSVYGIVTLGGSWAGFALIVAGTAAFCIDLRYESLGPFSLGGLAGLAAGSLLLFPSPWLRISPWVLAIGIVGMSVFFVSVMTRVLRDLRMIARGELEVTDAHQHLEGEQDDA